MGAGASVAECTDIPTIGLKSLPTVIDECIYVQEKFPIVIDPTKQASLFLKYQMGSFLLMDDPTTTKEKLNRALVGAMRYGRTITLLVSDLGKFVDKESEIFVPGYFPREVLQRSLIYQDEVWQSILKPEDPRPAEFTFHPFVFIICTETEYIPPGLSDLMTVIKVVDSSAVATVDSHTECDEMEQIASLYGASEIVRNSTQLVEAAFDGDLEEVKSWFDKGYHIESMDGRKHTALSEAAAQGMLDVVQFLLDNGADPNKKSDTGRSPLWRACFNGHVDVVQMLLGLGADPDCQDKVSMETCFDVAKTEEIREMVSQWNREETKRLIDTRRRMILSKIEERIKTSAEREQYAKGLIRQELINYAEAGNITGIKETLTMIAEEAEKTNTAPRATVEVRNELGLSLLGIAAQKDNVELATFLLTYWQTIDKDCFMGDDLSVTAKVFKANPNSRDLKGWNCCSVAVFKESKKVLALLLDHGGDPTVRSSYNRNAWDLAKDELDAAENIVKSKAEIRQVLLDYEARTASKIFGSKSSVSQGGGAGGGSLYKDLGENGSAVVMNIEMNNEIARSAESSDKKKETTKKSEGNTKKKSKTAPTKKK